jgi:high-affinity Fe2+/Pb2+ permease
MKGLRGVFAGVLILEAIVVLLALLVVARFDGTAATSLALTAVSVLAVAMILAAFVQRRPWGMPLALGLQVLLLLCGFLHFSMLIVGILFALVWGTLLYWRQDVLRRMSRGELPSQRG